MRSLERPLNVTRLVRGASSPNRGDITVKDEVYSPKRRRHHRLRSPVIIDEERPNYRSKRSRLSSPVLIKEEAADNVNEGSAKQEENSRRHGGRLRNDESENVEWGRRTDGERPKTKDTRPKEAPNFALSGKLAEDTNTFKGVVIKYNEPEDARKPTTFWRLYPFKGNEALSVLHIHRQSGYLVGRDRNIADLPMDHPSISKQHAALQFRYTKGQTRLYVIDLESANGTFLNNKKIDPRRYYELRETDVVKFGFSSREYVVMTDQLDDDGDSGKD